MAPDCTNANLPMEKKRSITYLGSNFGRALRCPQCGLVYIPRMAENSRGKTPRIIDPWATARPTKPQNPRRHRKHPPRRFCLWTGGGILLFCSEAVLDVGWAWGPRWILSINTGWTPGNDPSLLLAETGLSLSSGFEGRPRSCPGRRHGWNNL